MRLSSISLAAALLAGCSTVPAVVVPAPAARLAPLPASVTSELPRHARPYHYAIEVVPDATALTFTGTNAIDLELFERSNSITLNANALDITSATIRSRAGGAPIALSTTLDSEKEMATFTAPAALAPGRYTLDIAYSGKIGTQASGMFALDYPDKRTGEEVRALFSQFEVPDAREFAPLFDEPSYKATFDLSAVIPTGQMAVSNMPAASEEPLGNGTKRVRFGTTPPMSTYLLFFAAGEFERLATDAGDGVEVGIVAAAGSGETMRPALEYTAPLIGYFNDYFGVDYPLPKLDNVAAPGSSQQFGAMENWGAILTFEGSLLLDPKLTSPARARYLYTTIGHEVAHQWFGNIVTMAWWDDLWLNEGFASWMETKSTDHFRPEWHAKLGRVGGREAAMGLDSLATTHPVIVPAKTAVEADHNFDAIAYQKGEAVITMLEAYVGEDVWREGIRRYMDEHKFANARTEDLWRAVEAAGGKGMTAIADDYTTQPGIPLVNARATCAGGRTTLSLDQSQFSRDRKDEVKANPLHWLVPVTVRAADGSLHRSVLDGRDEMTVPGCGPVIVNGGQLGYFRTLYDTATLRSLTAAIPQLPPIEQLGLYRDSVALADAGYQPFEPGLDMLAAIPTDANAVVAASAVGDLETYHDLLQDEAAKAKLAALIYERWLPRLRQLGFDPRNGEPFIETALRATLIANLGKMGEPSVAAEARRRFTALATDSTALDGPLKTTWLGIAARNATASDWELLLRLKDKSPSAVEQATYESSLGSADDEVLAKRALAYALSPAAGKTTAAQIITGVAANFPDMTYDWAVANRTAVIALVDDSAKAAFLPALARRSDDAAMIGKLEALLAAAPEADRAPIVRTIASLKQRLATRPRTRAGVTQWILAR